MLYEELLSELKSLGHANSDIEKAIGMSRNKLSGYYSGKVDLPIKWEKPIRLYINRHATKAPVEESRKEAETFAAVQKEDKKLIKKYFIERQAANDLKYLPKPDPMSGLAGYVPPHLREPEEKPIKETLDKLHEAITKPRLEEAKVRPAITNDKTRKMVDAPVGSNAYFLRTGKWE